MYICINKRLNVHTEEKDKDNVHDEIPIRGKKKSRKGYVNVECRKILPHMFMDKHGEKTICRSKSVRKYKIQTDKQKK